MFIKPGWFLFLIGLGRLIGADGTITETKRGVQKVCTLGCMDMLLIQDVPMGSMKPECWQYLFATNHTRLHQRSRTILVRFDRE